MKKSKVFLTIIAAFFMFALTACVVVEEGETHYHTYGEWTMTVAPTETQVGVKERQCLTCDVFERGEVPVLTDPETWTIVEETPSTCKVEGSRKYSSEDFGEVTVALPLAEHVHDVWAFVVYPTEESAGSAKGACSVCGDETEVEVPALVDESVWALVDAVEADYNHAGYHTYESVYGSVTVNFEKFVAPYDGKTYSSFAFDAEADDGTWKYGVVSTETAWSNATLVTDENGTGEGTAFPFRGLNVFTMIDPTTGKIEVKNTPVDYSDPENPVLREDQESTCTAYVDMATGLVVKPFRSSFNYVHVLTPFEVGTSHTSACASVWEGAMAIQYTFNETTYSIFILEDQVFFGVEFKNELGEAVSAADCYNAPYVYITSSKGELIASYGFNGETEVELDGFEGAYAGEKALQVSGFGTLTLDGVAGVYVVEEGYLGAYVDNQYFEVTLNQEEKSYTLVKPEVEITFVAGEYASVDPRVVNKNIAVELPTLVHEQQTFKGWFFDEACTSPVPASYVPTENVTVYALWKAKVVINLVGVHGTDSSVLYLGEGDVIGNFLPKYSVDLETREVFKGWYIDEAFEETLTEDAEVTPEDTDFTVYAKWEKLPAYYGERKGTEIWSQHSGNSSKMTIKIDEFGNISGKYTGKVVEYNPETQVITWQDTKNKTCKFWFDETTDLLIADYYGGLEMGYDLNVFSSYQTNYSLKEFYGLQCTKEGSSSLSYYAHLIDVETENGVVQVLRYASRIYSNITVTSTTGEVLTTANVQNSKTVVIRNSETNEFILGLASVGDSFKANSKTVALDPYYGTYTNGEETVVLDGVGNIVYGEKTGTYAKSTSEAYGFDVYLEGKTEYYQLTLEGTSFVVVKPMVTVTFVTGEGHVEVPAKEYNVNIAVSFADAVDEGYVFNGWFFDEAFTRAVPASYVPTENVTIYAKYSTPAVLTIVYNNGSENETVVYSVGDIATVEVPVYAKHAFVGWYTTEDFQEDSVWKSGVAINEDVTIYAKWEVAPVYNNTYIGTEIETKESLTNTASLYTWSTAKLAIDPYGNAPKTGYPFNSGDVTVSDYNEETGRLLINCGSNVYEAYIEPVSGIMIMNTVSGEGKDFVDIMILSPFETGNYTSKVSASYWNNGKTYAIQYTTGDNTYSIFVHNNNVYFNVQFIGEAGAAVEGKNCYQSSVLYVYASESEIVAKFGHDGTSLQVLDGYEGTYTNGEDQLVIDGVKVATLNGVAGRYVKSSDSSYTLDVYVGGEFFEVTLNSETNTYTINKPFVVITFDAGDKATVEAQTVNKNIQITLPTPTNESFIFRGWCSDEECTTFVSNDYVPTTTTTLYAKWDQLIVVTVVYGNGLESVVSNYGAGDAPTLVEPTFTAGKVFNGWYLDEELTVAYVAGTAVTEDTTIYCAWMESNALYGEYKGFNTYGTGANPSYGSSGSALSIDAYGNVSGKVNGKVENVNIENGTFTLVVGSASKYGFFDLEAGLVAFPYGSSTTTLGTDFYIFIKGTSVTSDRKLGSTWLGGKARLLEVTVDGTAQYIFVNDNVVYTNVSYTSTDGEVAVGAIASCNQITIYDRDGNAIISYVKVSSSLEVAE
ncbi:MAG: InlB B-repeat-containing protein [Bacilli bacterium]